MGCSALAPTDRLQSSSIKICQAIDRRMTAEHKKGIRTMILMIAWVIWKLRNDCVFRAKIPRVSDLSRRSDQTWNNGDLGHQ